MKPRDDARYFWVIGGGEMQIPVIAEARALGLKVICSDLNPHCVCMPHADLFFPIDIFAIEAHVQKARELAAQGLRIVGVLAAGIDAPETMAAIAQALGLPGVDPAIARLVHDKRAFREKLKLLGFPVPKFASVTPSDIENLPAIAADIGYPLIVKNTDSSGSRGTRIFHSSDDAALRETALQAIAVSASGRALIESFWNGPEQTVETLFDIDGNFHPCFITDRLFDKSQGYALETGLNHPSSLPASVQDEMYAIAKAVATAIGINIGAAKYDFILTPEGPRIIEMTVRLSGGFDCQYLVPRTTGKNVIRAAILTAIGECFPPDLLRSRWNKVGISRSLWPAPGKINSIRNLEAARAINGVEYITLRKQEGDVVEPYTDCTKRVCFIIATGEDRKAANDAIRAVEQTLTFETTNS